MEPRMCDLRINFKGEIIYSEGCLVFNIKVSKHWPCYPTHTPSHQGNENS